jgi:hypothetical protein
MNAAATTTTYIHTELEYENVYDNGAKMKNCTFLGGTENM